MNIFYWVGFGLIFSAFAGAIIMREYYKVLATKPELVKKLAQNRNISLRALALIATAIMTALLAYFVTSKQFNLFKTHQQTDNTSTFVKKTD